MNEERGFFDRDFEYQFISPGPIGANDTLQTQISINVDAEFWAAAWYIALQTGQFEVTITDSDGYVFSNLPFISTSVSGLAGNPSILSPGHRFPAGGKIQLTIRDLSGAPNNIQIAFKGWKRFQQPVAQQ